MSEQCAGDTEPGCDEQAAGILARHDELRERANDEADDQNPNDVHDTTSFRRSWRVRGACQARCRRRSPHTNATPCVGDTVTWAHERVMGAPGLHERRGTLPPCKLR